MRLREAKRLLRSRSGRGGLRTPEIRLLTQFLRPNVAWGDVHHQTSPPWNVSLNSQLQTGAGMGAPGRAENSDLVFMALHFCDSRLACHALCSHLFIHSRSPSGPALCGVTSQLGRVWAQHSFIESRSSQRGSRAGGLQVSGRWGSFLMKGPST